MQENPYESPEHDKTGEVKLSELTLSQKLQAPVFFTLFAYSTLAIFMAGSYGRMARLDKAVLIGSAIGAFGVLVRWRGRSAFAQQQLRARDKQGYED